MSFEVRKDREDEVIFIPATGQTSWRGWKDRVHNIMGTCVCVCPNSRGARTLSLSRWVARCCAQWAGGMSWSNAGPGRSNGSTSAPCCLTWASPCAPPASRYSVYKTHSGYNLGWTTNSFYSFFPFFFFSFFLNNTVFGYFSVICFWAVLMFLCVYFFVDVSQWGLWTPGASTQLLSILSQTHRWTKLIYL